MIKHFNEVLQYYGFNAPLKIKQIYQSAWSVGDLYVLKQNDCQNQVRC